MLLLLDEHLGTDEIAQRLFISEHTVRSHVKSLLKKLGALAPPGSARTARDRPRLARLEAFERRFDEVRERLEVVAALEHRGHARRERAAPPAELAKTVLTHLHLGQRIVAVRVEARGDEQDVRLEGADCRFHEVVERLRILDVTGTAAANVDGVLVARPRAAGAGPERPLVERDQGLPVLSARKSASVPFPWWTSKSMIATSATEPACACRAAIATLLKMQNPIADETRAW